MSEIGNLSMQEVTQTTIVINGTAALIATYVLLSGICQLINIFGIVTNSINIACFVKQGFRDTINICLMGLSIADLGSLTTMMLTCILLTPGVEELDVAFESTEVTYLLSGIPHFAFTRVSSCITAMVALEKCISVVAPLRVKSILTPKRTAMITVGIFVIFIFSGTPFYVVNTLGFRVKKNVTVFGLIVTSEKIAVERITFLINNFIIPFSAFVIIAICTLILAVILCRGQKFTKTAINTAQANKMSRRNEKIVKMVATISTLFIVCFVPTTILVVAIAFQPELSVNGKYEKLSVAVCGFIYILEGINSSMNIVIYHHMSSKYRTAFRQLFIGECVSTC